MPKNIKVAPQLLKCKGKHAMKSLKLFVAGLIVICVTLLVFTWITRDSLWIHERPLSLQASPRAGLFQTIYNRLLF